LRSRSKPYSCPFALHPRAWRAVSSTAGLLARGSLLVPAFPKLSLQWRIGQSSPLTVAGAAAALDHRSAPHSLLVPKGTVDARSIEEIRPPANRIMAALTGIVSRH
jgi:hypothetical protein